MSVQTVKINTVPNNVKILPPEGINVMPQNQKRKYENCTNLYTQDQIKDLLKEIGIKTDSRNFGPSFYTMKYSNENGSVIINNETWKNDAVEISKDGSVKHLGSWHDEEIAPKGSFTFVVERIEKKIEESKSRFPGIIY